jgi:hypothetical protein
MIACDYLGIYQRFSTCLDAGKRKKGEQIIEAQLFCINENENSRLTSYCCGAELRIRLLAISLKRQRTNNVKASKIS